MSTPNNQRLLVNELFNFFVRLTKVLYLSFKSRLRETFGQLYEISEKLRDECKDLLKKMLKGYTPEIDGKDRKCVKLLVEREVLYYDPIKGDVWFQTKFDRRAAKELLIKGY